MKESWAITGFYGRHNFGDDLFCLIMSRLFSGQGLPHQIIGADIISSFDIQSTSPYFPNLPRESRLAKTARKTSEIIQSCQHHNIVFGGGSLFSKYSSYKRRSILAKLAKIRKSRLFAFGVSVGPFKDKDQQRKYCKLLSDFTLIVCRDKASSTYFNLENMVQGHDMAWCLPKLIPLDASRTDKRVLVIAISEQLAALALSELSTLPAHFDEILFIAMDANGAELHKALQETFAKRFNIPTSSYYYREKNLENVLEDIKNANFLITSKLHGAVTAASYGTPFALFEYQEKCTDFLREVDIPENLINFGDEKEFIAGIEKTYEYMSSQFISPADNRGDEMIRLFNKMVSPNR